MRLSLILGVCIVLCGGMIAQADLMNCVVNTTDSAYGVAPQSTIHPEQPPTGTVFANVLSYTRYANNTTDYGGGSLDKIVISLYNLGAMDSYDSVPTGHLIGIEGTWTCASGFMLMQSYIPNFGGTSPEWYKLSGNTYAAGKPWSYVNYPFTDASGVPWSETAGGSAGTYQHQSFDEDSQTYWYDKQASSYTSLYGSWSSSSSPLSTGSMLATFFVHHGDDVSFHSTVNADKRALGGWGFDDNHNYQADFTTAIPEPSTLFLVASGLVGLLCYAWRKRR